MKQKVMHKVMSILMSVLMILGCLVPFSGQVVYGATSFIVEETTQLPNKKVKKGEAFSYEILISLEDMTAKDFIDNVKVIDVTGATDTYNAEVLEKVDTVNIGQDTNGPKSYGLIRLSNMKYNGKNSELKVKVKYANDPEVVLTCSVDVEEKVGAGSGLAIDNNTVLNVIAGETQQINIRLKNTSVGRTEKGKMKLSVVESDNTSKGIEIKKKEYDIPELGQNETKDFPITLAISKNVTRGIHKLKVDIDGAVQEIKLKVDSNFMPASLMINATNLDGFKAGVAKDITLNIKNVGHIEAKNVKVELEQNDKVYILDGSNVRYVDNIPSGGSTSVKVKLQVSDPSAVSVPLKLNLSYIDDLGEEKKDSQMIYLASEQSSFNKEISITNIIEPTGTYGPNEKFTVKFTVTAPDGVKNVKLSVNGAEGIVPTSKNLFIISEMKPGAKQQYSVTLMATKDVKSSTYPIEIKAEYKLNNQDVSVVQYTTAAIHNEKADQGDDEEENKKGKPKVIIGNYKSEPVVVRAGEEFDLELGFLNTSKTKAVSNLKANLTVKDQGEKDTGSVFTPVGSSNTFFISDLAPGEISEEKIRLYTIPSANPKTYELTITMEYEDENGESITAEEHIGIPVEQVTDVEIAEVRTDMGTVGMPLSLSATLYNTGKTDVSNLMIYTEGEGFEVEDNKMFVGNFEKGASESYQPTIIPNQAGNLVGAIVLEYEDPTGKKVEIRQEFEMEVADMPTMPEEGMNPEEMIPMEEEQPSKLPLVVGIGVGVGLAAIVTVIVLKKRKAKREELELDED